MANVPIDQITLHDVCLAFEERIYDAVIEDLASRPPTESFDKRIVVVCLDTKDNPAEAKRAADGALDLCRELEKRGRKNLEAGRGGADGGLVDFVGEVVEEFSETKFRECGVKVLFQICYL